MKSKIIAQGAEATITLLNNVVTKSRIPKSYRHPDLDNKLRTRRTKAETKLLIKASKLIPTPKILSPDNNQHRTKFEDNKIEMQFISGKKLSDYLDKLKNYKTICRQIGINIAKLHDAGLIHGDLTTSNMILSPSPKRTKSSSTLPSNSTVRIDNKSQKVFFIDFGLGFHSDRIEDKAVDLHLIKQALEAKHPSIYEKSFKSVLEGYKHSKNYSKTIKQLKKVEKRGRYKQQY